MGFFDRMKSSLKTEVYLTKKENEQNANRVVVASSVIIALATVAAIATVMYYAFMQYTAIGLTTAIIPYVGTALAIVTASVVLGLFVRAMGKNTKTMIDKTEVANGICEDKEKKLEKATSELAKLQEEKVSMSRQLESAESEKENMSKKLESYASYFKDNELEDPLFDDSAKNSLQSPEKQDKEEAADQSPVLSGDTQGAPEAHAPEHLLQETSAEQTASPQHKSTAK